MKPSGKYQWDLCVPPPPIFKMVPKVLEKEADELNTDMPRKMGWFWPQDSYMRDGHGGQARC